MPLGLGNIFHGLFKQYGHTVILLLRFIDIAMLCGAAWVSNYFWLRQFAIDQDYRIVVALGILAAIIFFEIGQVYRPWRNDAMRGEIPRIVRAWVFAIVSVISIVALIRLHFWFGSSYRWIVTWWVLGLLFVLTARSLLSRLLQWMRARGWSQGRIILVGLNQMAVAVSRQLNHSSWAGLQVIGYVDDRTENRQSVGDFSLPRLGGLQDLAAIVTREAIDEVWIAFPGESLAERAQYQLRHLPVSIRLVIDCFAFKQSKFLSLNTVAGIPTLDFSVSPLHGFNRYIKEIMDTIVCVYPAGSDQSVTVTYRYRRQAEFSRPGVLPARAGWLEQSFVHHAEVPLDAGGRRSRNRCGLGKTWRKTGDPVWRFLA